MRPLVAVGPGRPGVLAGGAAMGQELTAASVMIGSAATPEAGTRVQVGAWEGPLGLLLAVIEARRLDVMTVPLGGLAEAYLDALAGLEAGRLGHISAFVAVASQLILIKSRALLPRHEEVGAPADGELEAPDAEAELRRRLIVYRAYRDAGARLANEALDRIGSFRREPAVALAAAFAGARASEAPALAPSLLADALIDLVRILPPPELPPEVVPRTVTLGERAAVIRAALRHAPSVVLQELLRGVHDRVVAAVTFLALLELMKRREVVVEQDEPFGPIVARPVSPAERAAAGLPGDVGEDPFDESMASFA